MQKWKNPRHLQWNFLPDVIITSSKLNSYLSHYLWSPWVTTKVLVELFTALLIHSTKLLELQTTLEVQGYITAYSTWTKFESWASFSVHLATSVSVPPGWYFKVIVTLSSVWPIVKWDNTAKLGTGMLIWIQTKKIPITYIISQVHFPK